MAFTELHRFVVEKNLPQLRRLFSQNDATAEINACDDAGYTPLMLAVKEPGASEEIVQLLLEHGADVHQSGQGKYAASKSVVALALGGGNPGIVRRLIHAGVDLHLKYPKGYTALIDALHSRDIRVDRHLIELLDLLIENRVDLNAITDYGESALRVLSRTGRFDAVKTLLNAGADADQLKWTPLLRAVAIGSLDDVKCELERGVSLEDRDCWNRTPWLLALQTGDLAKAQLLRERGAVTNVRGHYDKPPLFYAITSRHASMLLWLLEIGADVESTDKGGQTALGIAVENNNLEAVEILIAAGADLERNYCGDTPLGSITSRQIGLRLLDAGADPSRLSYEGHRALLGLPIQEEGVRLEISAEEFARGKKPRFGQSNPERIHERFWEEMIRTGFDSYPGARQFNEESDFSQKPVWCAKRFGQSITILPNGRIIQIAGEHEDSYDPDFCIYNDVFVHPPGGPVEIFGYPANIFPPTDFHSATLVDGRYIWIIGSLGYAGSRRYGETPLHLLDTVSMKIEAMPTRGDNPGWIFRHRARLIAPSRIEVSGGLIATEVDGRELHRANEDTFQLDTEEHIWYSM